MHTAADAAPQPASTCTCGWGFKGQQQNQRGLCRVAFKESAKEAIKLQMEKPSKVSTQDKSPIKKNYLGNAEAGMPKVDRLK